MKAITTAFLFLACSVLSFAQPRGVMGRKQLFDDDWKFKLGDDSLARLSDFKDTDWRRLDLPHDWSIEGKINPKNPTGGAGGYFPAGIAWYRKTFRVPREWNGKSVTVYFEGVYMNSEVFINGKSLGVRPYGYSSFSYDLSPYLNLNKENVIAVRVDNSGQMNSRWYSGSGIYRHVWMRVFNPVHVADWGVAVSTPEVSAKQASVQVKAVIKNETAFAQKLVISTQLLSAHDKDAGNNAIRLELPANSEKEITQTITVSKPSLWSPENPDLYRAQIQLLKGNDIIDETKTAFGIRTIRFTAEHGFQLNGKTVKINGGCVHHDNGCLGAAAFDRAEERKVELLKAAGFNAVRTSHNPPSEAFLDVCDRLGLLVIDEAFDGWRGGKNRYDYSVYFDHWWKRDLETMVLRDRNHPSIFMWSIGNEVSERKTPEAVVTAKMLAGTVKNIDTTRPVTSAIVTWGNEWNSFDPLMAVHDVCGYNYQLQSAPADHKRIPSRIIVQTESYPRDAFVNWKLVQNNSYIIGDFVWSAIDYLGESGIGRSYYSGDVPGENWENDFFPWHAAYCGDIDLIGWRKPISHYRSLLYNDKEELYMAVREPNPEPLEIKETRWSVWPTWESWTWPGFEGKKIEVEVYSKYPKVRLYLNNKLLGEKPTTEEQEYKAIFSVPYTPGLLKAVAVENDREAGSAMLQTSGNAAKIRLMADRKEIRANGQDLSYVKIEVTDKDGVIQPNATDHLRFKLEGTGTIAGVDNADIKDFDAYTGSSRKAWHGQAMIVIRSTHNAGDIKLTVTAPGLSPATLDIKTLGI
ncbi:glycoside hydrolase family 2 TIM barrel-domain containing protein [Mucilaginibacter sabulilitoris]|uniref:Glycoside hydrolase family 2 TIM barrel-domain containing protein n=1 Tax=Mucilaginibacter sabulilitoris TaxID=1173583 RepID=A0ABZ0TNZ4_9SPHI|nr:glycoside hydrolase family 2 TIM barrel-domain containing protein [Mucilaginibacter sabulilitoris]WPU94860.1 glycoside hydrolase family 2 TIM barrel-domain containing protein [Mucilaginibacter sabulilitoris]